MRRFFLTAILGSLVFATGFASAQATQTKNGIIQGTVFDTTRALIPGVKITLSNLEKNDVKTAVSNTRGEYSFEVAAGPYELKAELPGFETSIIGPIPLKENETLQMNITMAIRRQARLPRLQ